MITLQGSWKRDKNIPKVPEILMGSSKTKRHNQLLEMALGCVKYSVPFIPVMDSD